MTAHDQPWHRSEITTWIPPDHFPDFDINAGAGNSSGQDISDEIDPQLNQNITPILNSSITAGTPLSGGNVSLALPSLDELQEPSPILTGTPFDSTTHNIFDPVLQEAVVSNPLEDSAPSLDPHSDPVFDTNVRTQRADPVQLAAQVLTLQQEVMKQQELISQLQHQLTALQGHTIDATTHLAAVNASSEPAAEYSSPYCLLPGAREL